jgi:ATP-dependent Lhr-like helicase
MARMTSAGSPFAPLPLSEAARAWLEARFDAPTRVQREAWGRIAAGEHVLALAPTGSGKTLAAFLWSIDRLADRPPTLPGVRVLYVSPLKALVHDIERNLREPLAGLLRAARGRGAPPVLPRVAMRTGDTSQRDRRDQTRDPAEILVTTPESLYLILGSQQRETLRAVETVIVDEIHAVAATKRGAHLALSLERLAALAREDPQRIGLSATAEPREEIARFLGGDRPVAIVDAGEPPRLELQIVVPTPDMTRPLPEPGEPQSQAPGAAPLPSPELGMWSVIFPELLARIRAHQTTIVFVNSRALAERVTQQLNELAGERLARAHHGSVAHPQRREIEEQLKAGEIRAIVATSSLELGVDMQAVDHVVLVESPGSVSRGLQRVGRAGHAVTAVSQGTVFPKHRGDLLEAAVVARGMLDARVEPLAVPRSPLDVLAQQIVALCSLDRWKVEDLARIVRRSASFRDLSDAALEAVLDMLSGRYPSTDFAELRPRLHWDRERGELEGRREARRIALISGGTIPDRGQYAVHLGEGGPRVGELDEEMVNETRPGELLTLGASTWRVESITRDRVFVSPAPGLVGKLPFWRGEGPGRPLALGRALGALVRELDEASDDAARRRLREQHRLDALAARNLLAYVREQREATGVVPTDRSITIERFRDELGDWRVCVLSPFGARLHAPWALAIEGGLEASQGFELQSLWSDDGIVIRFAEADALPETEAFLPDPEGLEERVIAQLRSSSLFASRFRENAARALLLPRRLPGSRTPLWVQRLRAQNLLAVAQRFPSFPIVLETYRECLQDVFDLPGLIELLGDVHSRRVRVDDVETLRPSPFSRSLVFAYTAQYLYQGDVPLAERRAQALTLDRELLRDLLGQEELRDLLDGDALRTVETGLQALDEDLKAKSSDHLHDLMRRLGALRAPELAARSGRDPAELLPELERSGRTVRVSVAGEPHWIAAEESGLYRDALGVSVPAGLPAAFLEKTERPLEQLVLRYARTHGPFLSREVAQRLGLSENEVERTLRELEARGDLLLGEFRPDGRDREWCDPEVLRRIRRATLARLRAEVAPVEPEAFARFLQSWQGVAERGTQRLEEALRPLEGAALPFSELERSILPCRVRAFDPLALDQQGALGELVWIGWGALGTRDVRVSLLRREQAAALCDAPSVPETLTPLALAILKHLERRGACFLGEIASGCGGAPLSELLEALFELACAGLVTNDTFAALRALLTRRRTLRPTRRARTPAVALGRWSLVSHLLRDPPAPTERAFARASMLLDRYGVVGREAVTGEGLDGGMSALYPVFRAMEDAGRARRGHFVDGLTGAQFASPGAVDRLRHARRERAGAVVLSAVDPANPYGQLLPWPESNGGGSALRTAGARVVLVEGVLALYLDRGQRRALTFGSDALPEASRALAQLFADRRQGPLRLERIDDAEARRSPHAPALLAAGFRSDYKGLVLERNVR